MRLLLISSTVSRSWSGVLLHVVDVWSLTFAFEFSCILLIVDIKCLHDLGLGLCCIQIDNTTCLGLGLISPAFQGDIGGGRNQRNRMKAQVMKVEGLPDKFVRC